MSSRSSKQIVYRVTRRVDDPSLASSRAQRPQRGEPRVQAPLSGPRFETETLCAPSFGAAGRRAEARWPGDRIVAVEEASNFDKKVWSEEALTDLFVEAGEQKLLSPLPEDYEDFTVADGEGTALLVSQAVSALRDMNAVQGLDVVIEKDADGNPDYLHLMVEDNFSRKVPYRTVGVGLEELGDPSLTGWGGAMAVVQDVIDHVAPLT